MKVLKRNEDKIPGKWTRTCSCGSCGANLEVLEGDIFNNPGPPTEAVFQCPVCSIWNTVDVPAMVKARIIGTDRYQVTEPIVVATILGL